MKQKDISKRICSFYMIIFMLMIPIYGIWAQSPLNISGKVVDGNNEPMIGATVRIKGQQTGTITDMDGLFSIRAQEKDVLLFSYIGYARQEMEASKANGATIILTEDGKALEEVVVVGYATQKNVNLTGSVSTVNLYERRKPTDDKPIDRFGRIELRIICQSGSARPNNDGAIIACQGAGNTEQLFSARYN